MPYLLLSVVLVLVQSTCVYSCGSAVRDVGEQEHYTVKHYYFILAKNGSEEKNTLKRSDRPGIGYCSFCLCWFIDFSGSLHIYYGSFACLWYFYWWGRSQICLSELPGIGLYNPWQKHGRKYSRETMVFPFELEVFCLSKVICYQKEVQIRRGNGELSLWIVCISATLTCICHGIH